MFEIYDESEAPKEGARLRYVANGSSPNAGAR